jgi:hypothetical protein
MRLWRVAPLQRNSNGRKCPTVRKPRNPVRNNGRGRQCVQRHPGRGNTADRNYRPGHYDKKEGCQGSAQEASAQGVRKPSEPSGPGARGASNWQNHGRGRRRALVTLVAVTPDDIRSTQTTRVHYAARRCASVAAHGACAAAGNAGDRVSQQVFLLSLVIPREIRYARSIASNRI